MKPFYKAVLQLSLAAFSFFHQQVFSQPPTINFQSAITGLSAPLDIVNADDGSNRLFIVQQGGIIKVWNGTTTSDFIDLFSIISTGGERGLLSMAFHPDFNGTSNRYFFVYYTNTSGNIEVSRYQTTAGNSNTGDPSTQTVIITIPHPTNNNHNGGKLNFGTDGYLYFATGDGGGANDVPNNAQNGNVLLGKMIRVDINTLTAQTFGQYSIPSDNPYVGDASVRDEIWALGLRNPFRWSFDRANGNMWIGDVGQATKEEVNYRPAANSGHVNYGWRCYEGSISTPGVTDCTPADNVFPAFDYDNPNGGSPPSSAITGGYVYRGNEFASFRGYYVSTDFYSGTLYFLWPDGSGGFNSSTQTTGTQTFIAAFGEAENGALYAASQATNTVYKLVAVGGSPLPVGLKNFSVQHFNNYNEVKWSTAFEQGTSKFHIEYSTDGNHFVRAGQITASRNSDGNSYSYQHYFSGSSGALYRLAMEEDNGRINYSSVLRVVWNNEKGVSVYPTVVNNGVLNLSFSIPAKKLQVVNSNGAIVFEKQLNNLSGGAAINLPSLPKGMYVIKIMAGHEAFANKIIVN
jgi:glucose/arabinose dehydrogenase